MDIEKFKKESEVTYVYVKGKPMGLYYDKGNKLQYFQGYIQVPFRHKDFTAFDEKQQRAICEADLNKAGIPIHVISCDPFCFYEDQDQVNDTKEDDAKED